MEKRNCECDTCEECLEWHLTKKGFEFLSQTSTKQKGMDGGDAIINIIRHLFRNKSDKVINRFFRMGRHIPKMPLKDR